MINVPNNQLLGQLCLDNFVYDRVENPMDLISGFFEHQNLQSQLRMLKQLKNMAISYDYLEFSTANNPLYDHKMICNLLNGAWLLIKDPSKVSLLKDLPPKEQELFLNKECLGADVYPKHLSTTELIDPFQGIRNFFEVFTLQESHQQLYECLNAALSPNTTVTDEELLITFYKSLRKLMVSCWLIFNRNEDINSPGPGLLDDLRDRVVVEDEISPTILSGFKQFLNTVPVERLNRGLRKMLIDYLFYNLNGLPTDFEETLTDFYWLTDLLDEIQGKAVAAKFR